MDIKEAAQQVRSLIADLADELETTPCELESEVIRQSLMSDDCDRCHVHWLTLQDMLKDVLQ